MVFWSVHGQKAREFPSRRQTLARERKGMVWRPVPYGPRRVDAGESVFVEAIYRRNAGSCKASEQPPAKLDSPYSTPDWQCALRRESTTRRV